MDIVNHDGIFFFYFVHFINRKELEETKWAYMAKAF